MRKYCIKMLLICFFILSTIQLSFSQLVFNQVQQAYGSLKLNPSYSALHEVANLTLSSRYQWVGFEGAPQTQNISFHTPVNLSNAYVGFLLTNDKLGAERSTGFVGNFATNVNINYNIRASFGFLVGVGNNSSNFDIASSARYDELFQDYNITNLLVGAGFSIYNDKFIFGASAPFLISKKIGGVGEISQEPYKADFYFNFSYLFYLNEDFLLKPTLIYRYLPNFKNITDVGVTVFIKDKFMAGLIVRPSLSVAASAGITFFDSLSILYSNDIIFAQAHNYSLSSHEVSIKYVFNLFPARASAPKCYF